MSRRARHIALLAPVCAVLFFAGCTEDVAAPIGVEEPFSMYGIINPQLTTQTLLVSPIEDLLEPLDSSIDAVVTSTNLGSGEQIVWTDSVIVNETGQLDHVFLADFRPEFGSRHRIEARRSDNERSWVEADVPTEVEVEQRDTGTQYFWVTIRGESFRLVNVEVIYRVRAYYSYPGYEATNAAMPLSTYTFSKSGSEQKVEGGWRIRIDLNSDYETILSRYFDDHDGRVEEFKGFHNLVCDGLGLFEISIGMTVGSDDWAPPGGVFDPDVLIHPSTLSNVENGYGFVTGGYEETRPLSPSAASVSHSLFFDLMNGRTPEVTGCGHPVTSE